MNRKAHRTVAGAFGMAIAVALLLAVPVHAHHSFSIFDGSRTLVFTGVVTRVNPDANHLQIFFAPMNEERNDVLRDENGEPVVWAVEMGGSAAMARQGVSVSTFPRGTIFSVGLHPLRSGERAGSRETSGLFMCPDRIRPEPGMHCDSVEGHTAFGNQGLPTPTE